MPCFLVENLMRICRIHKNKPKVCADWPLTAGMLKEYSDVCGYWFDKNGMRHGSCNRCGLCCLCVSLDLEGFGRIENQRCPHLEDGE